MPSYNAVVCQACHNVVLVDGQDPSSPITLEKLGWRYEDKGWLCTCGKPKAVRVREPNTAFVRYDIKTNFQKRVGVQAAMQGFDCLSENPEYIKGHAEGMKLREYAANLAFAKGVK